MNIQRLLAMTNHQGSTQASISKGSFLILYCQDVHIYVIRFLLITVICFAFKLQNGNNAELDLSQKGVRCLHKELLVLTLLWQSEKTCVNSRVGSFFYPKDAKIYVMYARGHQGGLWVGGGVRKKRST